MASLPLYAAAATGDIHIRATFDQPLRNLRMVAVGGKKQRGGAGEVARVERRATRQQEINHGKMSEPRGMAERPGAEAVARIDRCAVIEQFGHQFEAIL